MTSPQATIAILSIGQMGLGIASLLRAHNFRVITNVSDRSSATQDRAKSVPIELFDSDIELMQQADYVLSIVPPKDSANTAQRIIQALKHENVRKGKEQALWFLDLNAGSPDGVKELYYLFKQEAEDVRFVDGCIIGDPPRQKEDGTWFCPSIPLSGPHILTEAPANGAKLAEVLNTQYLGKEIGKASGLKACFASLTKGFTALALQSYTTASNLDILPQLKGYMDQYTPGATEKVEKSIVGCTTKAYRWIEEMHQIGRTFSVDGGFAEQANVFREIAGVYQELADLVARQGTDGLDKADDAVGKLGRHLRGSDEKEKKES